MTSRNYAPTDAAATREVFLEAVSVIASEDYPPELIDVWLSGADELSAWAAAMEAVAVCRVLEDEAGLYAFGSLTSDGDIHMLMCHPRRARQGAATQLLAELVDRAHALGLKALNTQASLCARRTFEKVGFAVTEERNVRGLVCFGMRMDLA